MEIQKTPKAIAWYKHSHDFLLKNTDNGLVQNLSAESQLSKNLSRNLSTGLNLSRNLSTGLNISRNLSTGLNLIRNLSTELNLSRNLSTATLSPLYHIIFLKTNLSSLSFALWSLDPFAYTVDFKNISGMNFLFRNFDFDANEFYFQNVLGMNFHHFKLRLKLIFRTWEFPRNEFP